MQCAFHMIWFKLQMTGRCECRSLLSIEVNFEPRGVCIQSTYTVFTNTIAVAMDQLVPNRTSWWLKCEEGRRMLDNGYIVTGQTSSFLSTVLGGRLWPFWRLHKGTVIHNLQPASHCWDKPSMDQAQVCLGRIREEGFASHPFQNGCFRPP